MKRPELQTLVYQPPEVSDAAWSLAHRHDPELFRNDQAMTGDEWAIHNVAMEAVNSKSDDELAQVPGAIEVLKEVRSALLSAAHDIHAELKERVACKEARLQQLVESDSARYVFGEALGVVIIHDA